jgi:hypothetical protein
MTSKNAVVDSCDSGGQPDYKSVDLPSKPATDYHYTERRAEILQLIQQRGHPRAISQSRLAERYGVSQQQISKDLDRLSEYYTETLGNNRDLVTEAVFHRSIQGLLDDEEWRKAAQTVKDWNDWIIERKDLAEIQERLEDLERERDRP